MIRQTAFRSKDVGVWQELYAGTPVGEAIAGFREFREDYSRYFEDVISNEEFDSGKFTGDNLRSRYQHALEDYWAPLGEVAMQRQVEHYRALLDEGTDIAQRRYLPNLNLPGVLIYFNKVANIKYCPYTSLPFVGTPYSSAAGGDWMAIPHEIGHYLYWNLGSNLQETHQRHAEIKDEAAATLKEMPEPQRCTILAWLEEIFCDVVGVRLGGDEFVRSFQAFILSCAGNADELTENDGRHPPLAVRPFVREHALKIVSGETSGRDWDGFFKDTFGKGVAELNLKASPPNIKAMIKKMTKAELWRILGLEDSPEAAILPFVQSPSSEIIPAIETLVEYLNKGINTLLPTFQLPTHEAGAFQQLLDLVTVLPAEDQRFRGKPPYELLLRPRILERGLQHEHGGLVIVWPEHPIGQLHDPWVHNHT
jgi:hypothetical protein